MTMGEIIRNRRHELGLTLQQVGDKIGVGKSTVRKWEIGYIKNVRIDNLIALSEILDIPPIELIGESTKLLFADKYELQLLKYFRLLPDDDCKELIIEMTKSLVCGTDK